MLWGTRERPLAPEETTSSESIPLSAIKIRKRKGNAYIVPQPLHHLPGRRPAQETRDEGEPNGRDNVARYLQEDRRVLEDKHGCGGKARR